MELIGHYECKNKIEQNHCAKRGEDKNQKDNPYNGRIPAEILANPSAYAGYHFIYSGLSEFCWHVDIRVFVWWSP